MGVQVTVAVAVAVGGPVAARPPLPAPHIASACADNNVCSRIRMKDHAVAVIYITDAIIRCARTTLPDARTDAPGAGSAV